MRAEVRIFDVLAYGSLMLFDTVGFDCFKEMVGCWYGRCGEEVPRMLNVMMKQRKLASKS